MSHSKIGEVQSGQGNLAAALASHQASLVIAERLALADPGNAGWQRDLSVSYAKLASANLQAGETAKARAALTAGRAIIAHLVEKYPEWAEWKQDLAWFDRQIAAQRK